MTTLSEFLTVQEAAALLGVSPNTVRNWGRDEKIPEFRHPVNNYRLYRKKDLEKLLKPLQADTPIKPKSVSPNSKKKRHLPPSQ